MVLGSPPTPLSFGKRARTHTHTQTHTHTHTLCVGVCHFLDNLWGRDSLWVVRAHKFFPFHR